MRLRILYRSLFAAAFVAATFALTACNDSTASSGPAPGNSPCADNPLAHAALTGTPHHTLVFVDRSSSADAVEESYGDTLKSRIAKDLLIPGSELSVFLVHDRTTGMAGHQTFTQTDASLRHSEFKTEQAAHCIAFTNDIKKGMVQALKRAEPMLSLPVPAQNQNATDLWGLLEVASDAFADTPDGTERRVYVFSDLLECMRGSGRRCFERRAPRNRQEAETWGREDAARVQQALRVAPDVLARAHFTLLTGEHALREETRNAGYYWRTLLEELGVPARQIRVS